MHHLDTTTKTANLKPKNLSTAMDHINNGNGMSSQEIKMKQKEQEKQTAENKKQTEHSQKQPNKQQI